MELERSGQHRSPQTGHFSGSQRQLVQPPQPEALVPIDASVFIAILAQEPFGRTEIERSKLKIERSPTPCIDVVIAMTIDKCGSQQIRGTASAEIFEGLESICVRQVHETISAEDDV